MTKAQLDAMAYELADESAVSDIECHCKRRTSLKSTHWYDLECVDVADWKWVARAVVYLDARKRLRRHPDNPMQVQILEVPNG
ncbi:MAG TPA: hypothetical protein VFL54_04490 [Gammaproteobacteria bacterium]|nr:hypothetical protein [Gammaproteobacteria bacterium]